MHPKRHRWKFLLLPALITLLALAACAPVDDLTDGRDNDEPQVEVAQEGVEEIVAVNTTLVQNVLGQNLSLTIEDGTTEQATIEEMLINEQGIVAWIVADTGGIFEPADPVYAIPVDNVQYLPNAENTTRQLAYTGALDEVASQPNVPLDDIHAGDNVVVSQEFDDEYNGMLMATRVIGTPIYNDSDEALASIDDLVINLDTGEVSYAVADFGGFLGVAEKDIAIPWGELSFAEEQDRFTLPASQQMIEDAPAFVVDWAPYGPDDLTWDDDYATYWEEALDG